MTAPDLAELRVTDTLWILERAARFLRARFPMVEHDELVSVGYIALRKASDKFDPSLGVPFSSYAWIRVAGGMMDAVRKHATTSSRIHDAGFQAISALGDTGNVMRDDEVRHRATAREFLGAVAAAMRANTLSSYTAELTTAETDEHLDHTVAVRALRQALQQIDPQHARIVEQRYMRSVTLRTIAEELKVSYRTAQRRHNEALRALAQAIRQVRQARRE